MAKLRNGFPFDSTDFDDAGELPLVRIRDLNDAPFETFVDARLVPAAALIRDGEIVIGMDGDFNVRLWDRGEAALNQRLCVLDANDDTDARYLAYGLPEPLRRINEVTYATTVKHLSSQQVQHIRLPDRPLSEQRAIADFLDRETAQIDVMIEAQRGLVVKLEERRDAVWASLYMNADGRNEVQLGRIVNSIVDGPFGSGLTSAHYSDDGARVIRLGNIGVGTFKDGDRAFIPLEYAATLRSHAVEPGDVVMAGLGDERMPLGRAAVVPSIGPAIVKADCYRLRPTEAVDAGYLAWALSSPPVRAQIGELARGSTRQRLNTTVAKAVRLKLPTLAGQAETLQTYGSIDRSIDAMIRAANEAVALMRERRAALISAAVTARIDPRTGKEIVPEKVLESA